jgi:hypothetical protein
MGYVVTGANGAERPVNGDWLGVKEVNKLPGSSDALSQTI